MPKLAGLKSCKKLRPLVVSAADGEKKLGDIVGNEAGTGDKIPARSILLSIPIWSNTSLPIFACGDFSNMAADCGTADELEAPVRRWTSDMNSLGFVWMTLGEME